MAELIAEDLEPGPGLYQSSRALFDVLIGEDAALPLIEACTSGDNVTLQSLLQQPQWSKIALEEVHWIYMQDRPSRDKSDVRGVSAFKRSNLERAIIKASENGQAATVSTLLNFASQQGLKSSDVIMRWAVAKAVHNGHAAVVEALATADPTVLTSPSFFGHGILALDEAVKWGKTEVVAVLLQLGADPIRPASWPKKVGSYNSSLLSLAAKARGTRMTELLLEHGVSVNRSGALHLAAERGALDTMHLLIQHGADVNELLTADILSVHHSSLLYATWTPMHFAAYGGQVDAMKLLESNGSRSDVKDKNGMTPAQLLEQRKP